MSANLTRAAMRVVEALDEHREWHDLKQAICNLDEAIRQQHPMSASHDGGPAFPAPNYANANDEKGMSLRDWFAGMAMQALATTENAEKMRGVMAFKDFAGTVALQALGIADAMLAARQRQPESQPQPDDGWIEWNGGGCPIPDGVRWEYRLRHNNYAIPAGGKPSEYCWRHDGDGADIIAYRMKGGQP